MGAASAVVSGIQSGFSWGAQAAEQQAIYDEMKFNKQMAQNNAAIAEQAARDAELRGSREIEAHKLKSGGLVHTQRAAMSANGLDTTSGSAADILAATRTMSAYDEETMRANTAREAWQYRLKKQEIEAQSVLDQRKSWNKAAGSLLGEFVNQGNYGSAMGGSISKARGK